MSINTAKQNVNRQRGYMLIEVLVTIGILSVGLLGLAALQMTSLKASDSALKRSQAAIRIAELSNRMRANPQGVNSGGYHLGAAYVGNTNNEPGTDAIATADLTAWWNTVSSSTSHGAGVQILVDCAGAQQNCRIGIQWADERGDPQIAAVAPLPSIFAHEVQVVF